MLLVTDWKGLKVVRNDLGLNRIGHRIENACKFVLEGLKCLSGWGSDSFALTVQIGFRFIGLDTRIETCIRIHSLSKHGLKIAFRLMSDSFWLEATENVLWIRSDCNFTVRIEILKWLGNFRISSESIIIHNFRQGGELARIQFTLDQFFSTNQKVRFGQIQKCWFAAVYPN